MKKFSEKSLFEFIKTYNGEERIVNDSLHFGVSTYAYTEDLERCKADYPGFEFTPSLNPLFGEMTDQNLKTFIKWLYQQSYYLFG